MRKMQVVLRRALPTSHHHHHLNPCMSRVRVSRGGIAAGDRDLDLEESGATVDVGEAEGGTLDRAVSILCCHTLFGRREEVYLIC
jgi:hypothetical protein